MRQISIVAVIIVLLPVMAPATLVFNDGYQHTVDTFIDDDVLVAGYIRFGEPWRKTSLHIVQGGRIGGDVNVGSFAEVHLFSGGTIECSLYCEADLGAIDIAGGTVGQDVEMARAGELYISSATVGGSVKYKVSYTEFSIIDSVISGDVVTGATGPDCPVVNTTIDGRLVSFASPTITVESSFVSGGVDANNISRFSFLNTGLSGLLSASDSSLIWIAGHGFKVNGNDVGPGACLSQYGQGHLTGYADNGRLIDVDFVVSEYAEIYLVPEPSMFVLLFLGSVISRSRRQL